VTEPWLSRWSSSRAPALGESNPLLSYNVWYQSLGGAAAARPQRWRAFLLGEDPQEAIVRRGDWTVGDEAYRRRLQPREARPARRRGRPRHPPAPRDRLFPEL
jgi:hypothetical protein